VFLICRLPVILQRTRTRGLYYLRGARGYALTRSVGPNKVVLVREASSLNEVLLNVSNLSMSKVLGTGPGRAGSEPQGV
jgi:hypothetical protein